MKSIENLLHGTDVIPVVTPQEPATTVRLAEALLAGGMRTVEITLRNENALASISQVKRALPELCVAAGTVLNAADLYAARDAGADFSVSPGISEAIIDASAQAAHPLLPGVASASDIMQGMAAGLSIFKFFPAVPAGGIAMLKSFAGPFPQLRFCPTGGLTPDNFRDFLALDNVICCGGSWMVDKALIEAADWSAISALCQQASAQ